MAAAVAGKVVGAAAIAALADAERTQIGARRHHRIVAAEQVDGDEFVNQRKGLAECGDARPMRSRVGALDRDIYSRLATAAATAAAPSRCWTSSGNACHAASGSRASAGVQTRK